jgi:hypothetical protein
MALTVQPRRRLLNPPAHKRPPTGRNGSTTGRQARSGPRKPHRALRLDGETLTWAGAVALGAAAGLVFGALLFVVLLAAFLSA